MSALSYALDITEGQSPGHAVRTCLIGMRIADIVRLSPEERSNLFYALLLKDLGCTSNAARLSRIFGADDQALKRVHKLTDWTSTAASASYAFNQSIPGRGPLARAWYTLMMGLTEKGSAREMTEGRCERGADIAAMLGLEAATSEAIRSLDEHWDGQGMPYFRSGSDIPLLGRICGLAQTVEVFHAEFGTSGAYEMARARCGTWFDPSLVEALEALEDDTAFWATLGATDQLDQVIDLEPTDRVILADEGRLDQVAEAFAQVIDAKTPYTAQHSAGVAGIAVGIARAMGLGAEERRTLHRAGLLHDIGKLGVSNLILDKPGRLTDEEFAQVRKHPQHTLEILMRVRRFRAFAGTAAAHHERLDGSGYHLGLYGEDLGPLARILAVADVCEALSSERPYRTALGVEEVFSIMRKQVGTALCPEAFEGLQGSFQGRSAMGAPGSWVKVVGVGVGG
ncbi:MAG TPA: HD domain-containing phosphohydrolase [Gemmatimonadales bacterium]|nr:HD domain-containing phosphohydrolase [Gemmatimonadales bacterium]